MTQEGAGGPGAAVLKTLLLSDLVDSTRLVERLGDADAAELFAAHDRIARDLLSAHNGLEIDKTDGFLLLFDRPIDAVRYAMAYHEALERLGTERGVPLAARVGIHVGEVFLRKNPPGDVERGAKPLEVEGLAKPMAARLMSLATGGQTLLTSTAFELARRAAVGAEETGNLEWRAHGPYRFKGVEEPVPVFEVGVQGKAPLEPPPGSEKAAPLTGDGTVLGWRPGPGRELPGRRHWVLVRKLGEGGFGEAWLGEHSKTGERRVFKFCFDAERLRALQREVTLFRLMREALGNREDITRILDWNFDDPPYFVETEFAEGGSLLDWFESAGGAETMPLEIRLEIAARVAEALAAAHSVGVLHKDLKPANVLVNPAGDGPPRIRLTDFGIATVTDTSLLERAGITRLGLTGSGLEDNAGTGTQLYMAPELLEGRPATIQADIYALGVMLYQLVTGDLHRALAPGWERDVEDPLLRNDIAEMVDGSPGRRLGDAGEVARRLRELDVRRERAERERREREEAERAREALDRMRRRRKVLASVAAGLAAVAVVLGYQRMRIAEEAHRAEESARRAASQARTTRAVLDYVLGLFDAADPEVARGRDITARELVERGADRIQKELADQPEVRARVMEALGAVLFRLGAYDRAETMWNGSLSIRRSLGLGEDPSLARNLLDLASVRLAGGRLDEAETLLQHALELARDRDPGTVAAVEANLGSIAFYRGNAGRAAELWNEAIGALEASGTRDGPEMVRLLNNLAQADRELGRLNEAGGHLRRALDLLGGEGSDHPEAARVLSSLGDVARLEGRLDEAERLYRHALAIREKVLPEGHPLLAAGMVKLARVLSEEGSGEEALAMADRALTIARGRFAGNHPLVLDIRTVRAAALLAENRAAGAEREAAEVLRILANSKGGDPMDRVEALAVAGRARGALGRTAAARETLEARLTLCRKHAPGSLETAAAADDLARLELETGDGDAARRLLEEALAIRRKLAGPEAPITRRTEERLGRLDA